MGVDVFKVKLYKARCAATARKKKGGVKVGHWSHARWLRREAGHVGWDKAIDEVYDWYDRRLVLGIHGSCQGRWRTGVRSTGNLSLVDCTMIIASRALVIDSLPFVDYLPPLEPPLATVHRPRDIKWRGMTVPRHSIYLLTMETFIAFVLKSINKI